MPGWFVNVLVFLGVSAPLLATIWGCFNALDRSLKPKSRRLLARYLAGLPSRLQQNLPNIFVDLFDFIFRTRTVSWRRLDVEFPLPSLWRSFQVSLLLSTALAIVFAVRIVGSPHPLLEGWTADMDASFVFAKITAFLLGALLFNTFVDYFSLLESRFILKKMFSSKYVNSPISTRRLILFTIVDFVSTFIILYLSWIFIGPVSIDIISFSFFEYEHDNLREVIDEFLVVRNLTMGDGADIFSYGFSDLRSTFRSYFSVDDPTGIYGVFVISSFFTSIWVWLFVVGAIAARITSMIGTAIGVGSRHFHFVSFLARHPLRLVGYSLMICVGAFSLILRASSALPSGGTDQTGAFRPPHWVVMSSVRSSAGRQGCGRMPADMAQIDPSALHDLSRCPRFPNEPNSEKGPTLS